MKASLLFVLGLMLLSFRSLAGDIIFLGDGNVARADRPAGFINELRRRLPRQTLVNAGREGDRYPDLLARLQVDVLAHRPRLLVIYGGSYDVWLNQRQQGTPQKQFVDSLQQLLGQAEAAGVAVIVCTPALLGEKLNGGNYFDNLLEEYVSLIYQVVEQHSAVTLVDLRRVFLAELELRNPNNLAEGVLTEDGVLLNPAGHALVAEQLLAYLQRL